MVNDQTKDSLVEIYQQEIREADGIIIVHPNWWGQPPAILKGWVDRVLQENVAYTFPEGDNGGGLPIGLLKAKRNLSGRWRKENDLQNKKIGVVGYLKKQASNMKAH